MTKSVDVRLTKALHRAVALPTPATIARTILASTTGAHNGLRAATYEARVRGTGIDSDTDDDQVHLTVTERLASDRIEARLARHRDAERNRQPELTHLRNLNRAGAQALDAIASLNAECDLGYNPDTYDWARALTDAQALLRPRHPDLNKDPEHDPTKCSCISLLEAAEAVGRNIDHWVTQFERAINDIAAIHKRYQPHQATRDEQHWTDGLANEDCCAWHLEIHDRYRRPRVAGTNVCADCRAVAELLGQKPRRWLLEAMIDHGDRPIAWRASLSRAMDELGIKHTA